MPNINREDMLELTRRMTVKRNCFHRIAGAYLDADGFIDGTFNIHFQKLSSTDQEKNLKIAKAIPFSETNEELKLYHFSEEAKRPGNIWSVLMGLRNSELKNDALLESFYEFVADQYSASGDYAIYMFYGSYDVPVKAKDKASLWDSEEVYNFLICAICPVSGDYEPGDARCGFLFPAFTDHSSDLYGIDVFHAKL
mgnify:FL=1